MSSQRVIQDSDDEDGDVISDVASSCDPLQDKSCAPKATNTDAERVHENQPALEVPFAESDLPQVDFDRFLRSESSIMAGDYEDERWVSTANSNSANVVQLGNYNTEELQDNSFRYTVNATHHAQSVLPPTSNGGYDTIADNIDHPSKRRKVLNTQDTMQHGPADSTETDSSYNFFASLDPNGPSQTATSLPPIPIAEENNGTPHQADDFEMQPLPVGTPPPTVPFSEDPPPQEQGEIIENVIAAGYEMQETAPQQPPSETDTEVLSTKKKRGRPKKQDTSESADMETKVTSEVMEQPVKKKPGRPKKQENDTTVEQLPIDDPTKDQKSIMDEPNSTTTTSKAAKRKIKRSKTTSDLPNNKSSEMKAEQDVVWIETNPINSAITIENKASAYAADEKTNTTEPVASEEIKVPKKRGRKRKGTAEEPEPTSTENQAVLQDISNIQQQQAPKQDKQKDIEIEIDSAKNLEPVGLDMSKATDTFETPNPSDTSSGLTVEIQSKEGGKAPETPTTHEKNKPIKQTPISSAGRVPFRVGLSRRARIAPLLKVVRK